MTHEGDRQGSSRLLDVGYVAGAHGVRGDLRVHLHDAESEALAPGRTLHLHKEGEAPRRHRVESTGPLPGKANRRRVTVQGLRDRDVAEALRGFTVLVDRDELPPLQGDEFYLADAIGLPVVRQRGEQLQALGEIEGVTTNGAQDLFEVRYRAPDGRLRQWLLPVLPHTLVSIDDERVLVDPPLGLLPEALEGEP